MQHKCSSIVYIFIVTVFLCITPTFASSGAPKKASIKKRPDGLHYGYHDKDNHWHQAKKSDRTTA